MSLAGRLPDSHRRRVANQSEVADVLVRCRTVGRLRPAVGHGEGYISVRDGYSGVQCRSLTRCPSTKPVTDPNTRARPDERRDTVPGKRAIGRRFRDSPDWRRSGWCDTGGFGRRGLWADLLRLLPRGLVPVDALDKVVLKFQGRNAQFQATRALIAIHAAPRPRRRPGRPLLPTPFG